MPKREINVNSTAGKLTSQALISFLQNRNNTNISWCSSTFVFCAFLSARGRHHVSSESHSSFGCALRDRRLNYTVSLCFRILLWHNGEEYKRMCHETESRCVSGLALLQCTRNSRRKEALECSYEEWGKDNILCTFVLN